MKKEPGAKGESSLLPRAPIASVLSQLDKPYLFETARSFLTGQE